MKQKKAISLLLAVLLVCTLCTGCRSNNGTSSNSSTVSGATSSGTGSTVSGTESHAGTASGGTTSGSTASGTQSGTMSGTAKGLSHFSDTMRELYGNKYYPDTELTEEEIKKDIGLTDDLYEEVYGERSAQDAHPDTFIAVKVKDGKTKEVEDKLEAYKKTLQENSKYAAHTEKLNAAKVYSEGDYVFLVLLGDVEDNTASEGMAEAFGKEVQKGIDAIKKAVGAL